MQDALERTGGVDRIVSNEAVKEILNRFDTTQNLKLVPIIVADDSPLYVNLNGDTATSVQARSLTGDTLAVGATGFALWAPPLPPLAFLATGNDSGWVNLTYTGSFTAGTPGQLAYRKIGNRVTIRGGATHGTNFTAGAALAAVATLPSSSLYPVSTWRVGTNGSNRKPFALEIRSDTGQIQLAIASEVTGTQTWGSCTTSYLTD